MDSLSDRGIGLVLAAIQMVVVTELLPLGISDHAQLA